MHRQIGVKGLTLGVLLISCLGRADPVWNASSPIPVAGRPNPYELSDVEFARSVERGRLHAQTYPVEITAILLPEHAIYEFVEGFWINPFRALFQGIFRAVTGFTTVDQIQAWLGLHPYPEKSDEGVYSVPYPRDSRPEYRVGYGTHSRFGATGVTFSCAACHSGELFGKTVLGMTNRFPRANELLALGRKGTGMMSPSFFQFATAASDEERRMYRATRRASAFVGSRVPAQYGLDTSLAHTALSLAHRAPDEWASLDRAAAENPRPDPLDTFVADSKPAVWWNVKYKNRFLSDGSVVSGNPIYTNLLWNEIGRGTDLRALDTWLAANADIVQDLASAVFASEAPRFTDFFPAERIPLERARRGQAVFGARCAACHGTYEKAWDLPGSESLPLAEQLRTKRVSYHERTPVVNVGTDPNRARGMLSLERALNGLALSRNHDIRIETQNGYVPPPLVGIWARWPYFHNNSAPSLCAVLTRASARPSLYAAVPAEDREQDFDSLCNGYPEYDRVRPEFRQEPYLFDTRRDGLRNTGHDEGIFLRDGREVLTSEEKADLILFLQTL